MNGTATAAPGSATAWRALWQPWRELTSWPPLSWLKPEFPVRLLRAGGAQELWIGGRRTRGAPARARASAVELPEDLRLDRQLRLPRLSASALAAAVALEAQTASPFEPGDLAWGWRARAGDAGTLSVELVLASHRAVQAVIDSQAEALRGRPAPEVWALDARGAPIVLEGFGEGLRRRWSVRGHRVALTLLAVGLVLAAAAAVTPTAQLKWRAVQAVRVHQETERRLAPVLALREKVVRQQADVQALRDQLADHVEPLAVLERITQIIPDDTFLQRLQVQGAKVTATGQTPNAAALMNALSEQAGLRDVRAPSPATRAAVGRENFVVEWQLDAALRQPALAALGKPAS